MFLYSFKRGQALKGVLEACLEMESSLRTFFLLFPPLNLMKRQHIYKLIQYDIREEEAA